jgi:hypothetical protein
MRTESSSVRLRTSLFPFFRQDRRNCYNITFILEKRVTRTNLITGFLGSGKTTSILHLLAQKPADEKWAVLVNEFGEVGIDGALLADSGALLKEIPGGCMCCVNGLPMQVGLNTLLRQGKPDRLLIEPTGLGHPKQILDILTAAVYEPWIDLRATLCILDPRQLLDEKASTTTTFAISWPRRTSLWPIKAIGKRPKAPRRWPTGGSAGAASVARCRRPREYRPRPAR